MDDKEASEGIGKAAIGAALKQLRESKFRRPTDLFEKTLITLPTITKTELGQNMPSLPIIQKWVEACGTTLSEFFRQFEGPRATETKVVEPDLFRLLQKIIETGDPDLIHGIRINLRAISGELPGPGPVVTPKNGHAQARASPASKRRGR